MYMSIFYVIHFPCGSVYTLYMYTSYMHVHVHEYTKLFLETIQVTTLHMREAGTVLKVLERLADTPGGGSNTKIRPALNRFDGS